MDGAFLRPLRVLGLPCLQNLLEPLAPTCFGSSVDDRSYRTPSHTPASPEGLSWGLWAVSTSRETWALSHPFPCQVVCPRVSHTPRGDVPLPLQPPRPSSLVGPRP